MQVFQDRRSDSLGHQPGEQMLAADLFRTVCASVLSGAVEAGLQAGCGPGGVREHISRRSVGEMLCAAICSEFAGLEPAREALSDRG